MVEKKKVVVKKAAVKKTKRKILVPKKKIKKKPIVKKVVKKVVKKKKKKPGNKAHYIVGTKLTMKQTLFCKHYIQNDMLRGNGTMCYNEAFNFKLLEKDRTRLLDVEFKEVP